MLYFIKKCCILIKNDTISPKIDHFQNKMDALISQKMVFLIKNDTFLPKIDHFKDTIIDSH